MRQPFRIPVSRFPRSPGGCDFAFFLKFRSEPLRTGPRMCSADASGPPTPERTPRGGHSMAPAPVTLRRGQEEGRLKWGDLLPQQQGTNSGPGAQNARWTVTPELHFRCVQRPPRPALRSGPASASPPAASAESPRLRDRSARLSTRGRRVPPPAFTLTARGSALSEHACSGLHARLCKF